jgi:hypothetical protein
MAALLLSGRSAAAFSIHWGFVAHLDAERSFAAPEADDDTDR